MTDVVTVLVFLAVLPRSAGNGAHWHYGTANKVELISASLPLQTPSSHRASPPPPPLPWSADTAWPPAACEPAGRRQSDSPPTLDPTRRPPLAPLQRRTLLVVR
eukprot:CAMPEP_0202845308 /NCGR_PEP_ID=MMETSP1389-20130828/69794_1 /ASSEMBLY_ACC=CAM_ASM_000865 /TAXON_ID=302021 /ORGANISM="Rhodomonas sp., Strain CCMP768" /LENGTH=103 /DNA_ID=CAMNT_0049522739 /DNA_START=69 /DNA_END=377 /DNA_ORIENTATION=+